MRVAIHKNSVFIKTFTSAKRDAAVRIDVEGLNELNKNGEIEKLITAINEGISSVLKFIDSEGFSVKEHK